MRTAKSKVSNDKVFRTTNALKNTDSTNPVIERTHIVRDLIIEASNLSLIRDETAFLETIIHKRLFRAKPCLSHPIDSATALCEALLKLFLIQKVLHRF